MSTTTSPFPDVNVWLALAHDIHPHHAKAVTWARSVDVAETFFVCRFSQLSVLRLLTNRGAMGDEAMTEVDAWRTFDRLATYWGAALLDEPADLERLFRERTRRREISTKRWADGYLTAFAEGHGLSFVTFDQALAKETTRAVLLADE